MGVESVASLPHPVLDDSKRMMRIIANPLYDQLTVSRAAHIRRANPADYDGRLVRLNRRKKNAMNTSVYASNREETIITPLPTNKSEVNLNSVPERQPLFHDRHTRQSNLTKSSSMHVSTTMNSPTSPPISTVRYMKSRHGFEIQRYSSPNWLSVDLISKHACQSDEKTFREMLEKQEQHVILPHETYTLDYYRRRYGELLQSYKQGHLTHDQWAKQNYQLHCLKTLYAQTFNREQHYLDLHAQKQRERHAQQVFKEWKDAKAEEKNGDRRSRSKTNHTPPATEITSVLSNPSFSLRSNTTNRLSSSTLVNSELVEPSVCLPASSLENTMKTLYMLDNRRSSLKAMIRRVVGLEEPLPPPPPPKILTRRCSSKTTLMEQSRVESNS